MAVKKKPAAGDQTTKSPQAMFAFRQDALGRNNKKESENNLVSKSIGTQSQLELLSNVPVASARK